MASKTVKICVPKDFVIFIDSDRNKHLSFINRCEALENLTINLRELDLGKPFTFRRGRKRKKAK